MAPPRRVRDEVLTLRRTGSRDIELFRAGESIYLNEYPTQNRFQVAPDAGAIAFTTPQAHTLTVVRRDGTLTSFDQVHTGLFRFAPDGQSLVVPQYDYSQHRLIRVETRTMQDVARDPVQTCLWGEFCAEGFIVLQQKYTSEGIDRTLALYAPKKEPRILAHVDDHVQRFVCAKNAMNLVYFERSSIWSLPNGATEPVRLASVGSDIVNAEMSPDGRSFIVVTTKDAFLFQDGKLVKALGIPRAHTVWFSHDGSQFVVVNEEKAHWQRGEQTATLEGNEHGPIRAARFAPRSPWVMVARGADAIRWNPDQNQAETITRADEGHEMLAVDVFAGGVVTWTGSTWEIEKRPGFGKAI